MTKIQYLIIGAFVGLSGLFLLAYSVGYLAAIAVFLMIYGNNLERSGHKDN